MPTIHRYSARVEDECQSQAFTVGNAEDDGVGPISGWFVGHFVGGEFGLRRSDQVAVKWGVHRTGEEKTSGKTNLAQTTLTLLIHGRFAIRFSQLRVEVTLERPGDYVIFCPDLDHSWVSLSSSVVVTVRWPSGPDAYVRQGICTAADQPTVSPPQSTGPPSALKETSIPKRRT